LPKHVGGKHATECSIIAFPKLKFILDKPLESKGLENAEHG